MKKINFFIFLLISFIGTLYSQNNNLDSIGTFDDVRITTRTISSATVFNEPEIESNYYSVIPKYTKIEILEYQNDMFKIVYKGQDIPKYIHSICVENTEEVKEFKVKIAEKLEVQKAKELKRQQDKNKREQTERERERERIRIYEAQEAQNRKQIEENHRKAEEKQRYVEAQERKQNLIQIYGKNIAARILDSQVWIVMTKAMLIESIGNPDDINRTVTAYGTKEQFVYKIISEYNFYYFENGKLTSWQD